MAPNWQCRRNAHAAKTDQNGLKWLLIGRVKHGPKYALQTFPKRPGSFLGKTTVTMFGPKMGILCGGPSAARYGILPVRLGHFEGVETTKTEGLQYGRVPEES